MTRNTQRASDLLASVTAEMLGEGVSLQDNSLRVERLLLDLVRPDPVQPRRVLPERVHFAFHNGRLTPTQALRELVQIAQVAARQRSRPFSNVIELLPNGDDEHDETSDTDVELTPEEQLLRDLVNLAVTIRDDGQVNPLTVIDASQGATRLYRIETGERRYWATWLLRDFLPGYTGDSTIPCIVVPPERASVFRQAKENTARTGLTAVAMARQAALLLLTVHGYEIPSGPVTNDFYRQALELDLRGKREFTEAVLTAMGGLTYRRFHQYKSLLHLSDEALEMADRYGVLEGKLRPVLNLPPDAHVEMVQHILKLNLTARQIEEICQKGWEGEDAATSDNPVPQVKRFFKTLKVMSEGDVGEFVRVVLAEEKTPTMARARIDNTVEFLLRIRERLPDE